MFGRCIFSAYHRLFLGAVLKEGPHLDLHWHLRSVFLLPGIYSSSFDCRILTMAVFIGKSLLSFVNSELLFLNPVCRFCCYGGRYI